ncbi:hypothetical protein BH10ACT6_BH10ACT6_00470 [soil metagenome]
MNIFRRLFPSPRTARGKLGIVAFLVTFFVLVGSTASYAFWTASLSVTSTVSAANLTIATSNLTSALFGNDALTSTGSITATNSTTTTSTTTGSVTLTVTGAGTLAAKVTRYVWTTTSAANCTAGATMDPGTTGTLWSTPLSLTSTLAHQASAIYCVRSTIATRESVAVSGGAMSFTPNVAGTITLGNFTGSAATAAATQATQYIYPAFSTQDVSHWFWIRPNFENANYNYCLDVSGAATTPGTIVISYGCKTSGATNQQWKFTQVTNAAGNVYYTIQPRNSASLRIDNTSSSSTGAGMIVDTAAGAPTTATDQQWQLQQISSGVFEFVNGYSGMCLTSPSGAAQNLGQVSQAPCNGSQYQQFLISQAFETFTCTLVNNSFTWGWTSAATGPYHVLVKHGSTTTELATTAATATGASIAYSAVSGYGTGTPYSVTFVDGNGTVVGLGTVTPSFFGAGFSSCAATDPSV